MSTWEQSELSGCVTPRIDFYGARLKNVRLVGCDLSESDFTRASLDEVRLHRSKLELIKGGASLKGAVISSDQVVPLAYELIRALGIRVEDEDEDEG